MAFVAQIMTRIAAQVPELAGRIEGAADLAEMMRQNRLPQVTPAVNVIPLGVTGGKPISMVGNYRQDVDRLFGVVVTIRTYEAQAARAQTDIEVLLDRIVMALIGWTPDDGTRGVFRLVRWALFSVEAGTLVYRIDFAIPDFIRSLP